MRLTLQAICGLAAVICATIYTPPPYNWVIGASYVVLFLIELGRQLEWK